MLPYLLMCLFALLTLFYCVATTTFIVLLYRRLRAKDRETDELRAALRLFEDVRQAVVYLSRSFDHLYALHGNLADAQLELVRLSVETHDLAARGLRAR